MKERLVEDWLTSINERGYDVPFCQSLVAKGYRILRFGHSPVEHGKDVLAIAPDGAVCGYQLKTGDFGQAEITKHLEQLRMLVETRPIHPALPASFEYRPFLVTTGDFKDPAISLIRELNASWQHRNLPQLQPINGRQLHVDFVALSADFWPIKAPAVRQFRELYLSDGRGDLDLSQFASFLSEILAIGKSSVDYERRVAATNVFASYLLGEFYKQGDHWSVFQGWVVCAAQIAAYGEARAFEERHWVPGFSFGREAAVSSLKYLTDELLTPDTLKVWDPELDEFTRTRNTFSVAAGACYNLILRCQSLPAPQSGPLVTLILDLLKNGRLLVWGEGALSQFLMLMWLLEAAGNVREARAVLMMLIDAFSEKNAPDGENAYDDPYVSADEALVKLFNALDKQISQRPQAIESYTIFPLVILAVRRELRTDLERLWAAISHLRLTWFRPEKPSDLLLWRCKEGKEFTDAFAQPQSWKELQEIAVRDDQERLPRVIRDDASFGLAFMLAFPHRIALSLIKFADSRLSSLQS